MATYYIEYNICILFKPQLDTKSVKVKMTKDFEEKLSVIKTFIQTRDLWVKLAGLRIL